jgi:nitrite reductase (NADH) small subunit
MPGEDQTQAADKPWRPLALVSEVPPGGSREVVIGDRIVAVFNVEGQFYAVDGICLHAGGPIAEGKLEGCVVTCPWHGWQYDVTTGKHCLTPRLQLDSFPLRINGEQIEVQL